MFGERIDYRKHLMLFVLFFIAGNFTGLYAQLSHSIVFQKNDLVIQTVLAEDGNNYNKLIMSGLYQTAIAGNPSLPVKYIKLIIPAEEDAENVAITFSCQTELNFHQF